jgi:hypothetical protein
MDDEPEMDTLVVLTDEQAEAIYAWLQRMAGRWIDPAEPAADDPIKAIPPDDPTPESTA